MKNVMGNLIGITLNLLTALGSMVILMILIQSKSMGYLSISLFLFLSVLSLRCCMWTFLYLERAGATL